MLAQKNLFFSCMYKMSKISKKCEIEINDKGKYFWINRKDLGIESGYKNWAVIFDKCDQEKQKYRYELMSDTKFQSCRRFVRNHLAERKILASEQFLELKEKLQLDPNERSFDEQDISAL